MSRRAKRCRAAEDPGLRRFHSCAHPTWSNPVGARSWLRPRAKGPVAREATLVDLVAICAPSIRDRAGASRGPDLSRAGSGQHDGAIHLHSVTSVVRRRPRRHGESRRCRRRRRWASWAGWQIEPEPAVDASDPRQRRRECHQRKRWHAVIRGTRGLVVSSPTGRRRRLRPGGTRKRARRSVAPDRRRNRSRAPSSGGTGSG